MTHFIAATNHPRQNDHAMTKAKTKAKLGMSLIDGDNKSLSIQLNSIKAHGAIEIIDFIFKTPFTSAESELYDNETVFTERAKKQRRLLAKLVNQEPVRKSKKGTKYERS